MKKKRLRRALINSIMSLTLCCAMLIGTTYAWMVDSVRSTNNRITAARFEMKILSYDVSRNGSRYYTDISGESGDLFEGTHWEPGTTKFVNLAVRNEGDVDLKYEVGLVVRDAGLAELLEYSIVDVDEAIRTYGLSFEAIEKELYGDDEEAEGPAVYRLRAGADDKEEEILFADLMEWEPLAVGTSAPAQAFSIKAAADEEETEEETGNGGVSYMVITDEKEIPVPKADEAAVAVLDDEEETDPRLNHYVLSVKMKDILTKEEAERFKNAQCEIDICIVATQSEEAAEDAGDGHEDEIIIPVPALENHIYHFANVTVTGGDGEEEADRDTDRNLTYETCEPVYASSLSGNIQIVLPEGMLVDGEDSTGEEQKILLISVSPESLMDDLEYAETKQEQTLDVQIHGLAPENEAPFTLAQYIGEGNILTKIVYTGADEDGETKEKVLFDAAGSVGRYETDPESGYMEAEYDKETDFGFEYDPGTGEALISSTRCGSYTLFWEPSEEETEEDI